MCKLFKFTALTLIAVIFISTIVFAYSRRTDIIRSVSPDLHFEMTLTNTINALVSEINSVYNNELISRLDEILMGDFNINMQLNLDAFADHESPWYWPMPQVTADFTNSRWNRALYLGLDIELADTDYDDFHLDFGAYFTNERFIVRFFDESVFVNARDPLGDVKAFSELNDLGDSLGFLETLFDFFGNDLSYDNIRALLIDSGDFTLSEDTIRNINAAYRNLFRSSRISVRHREIEFNDRLVMRDVTTVVIQADTLNEFIREVILILLDDEALMEFAEILYRLYSPQLMLFGLWTPSFEAVIDMILEEVQELEIVEYAVTLEFIESGDRYIGVIATMENYDDRVEIGFLGQRNMLDHIHVSAIYDDYSSFRISIIGDHVRTNHFRSEFTFENRFMSRGAENVSTTSVSLNWDTARSADNFSLQTRSASYREGEITHSSTSNIRGTFALTRSRNILFYLSSARGSSEFHWDSGDWRNEWNHNLAEDDLRVLVRRFSGRMTIPQHPRAFRHMTVEQVEALLDFTAQ